MQRRLSEAWRDESGQTLVLGALCLVVLIGFLGICIDVGHARYARNRLQMAADATAMAAGLEMRVCGASNPCNTMMTAGQSALVENGYTNSTAVSNCAAMPAGVLAVSFNMPPCAQGSSDPNRGNSGYLEVQLQQPVSTFFARAFGWPTFTISARAEVWHGGGPCIYALDPSGAGAISTVASLTSTCAIVDESTSSSALSCTAGTISAPQINLVGGNSGVACSTSPAARTGAPVPSPADPLKYLTMPTVPACGTSVASPYTGSATALVLAAGNYVLYPGKAYCGGITIQAAATVTFMPGTYVITGPALTSTGLTVSLLATVTGNGVTFYNNGPNGALSMTGSGTGNVTLTAPNSGTYRGLLYIQDSADTTASTVTASASGTTIQGGFYLPAAKLSYYAASPGPYTMLVAKDLAFTASALTLRNNFSSLTSGSPLNADNVQLVQ